MDYKVRYRPELELVLNGINCGIKGTEKVRCLGVLLRMGMVQKEKEECNQGEIKWEKAWPYWAYISYTNSC